jgi:hypothetical protein
MTSTTRSEGRAPCSPLSRMRTLISPLHPRCTGRTRTLCHTSIHTARPQTTSTTLPPHSTSRASRSSHLNPATTCSASPTQHQTLTTASQESVATRIPAPLSSLTAGRFRVIQWPPHLSGRKHRFLLRSWLVWTHLDAKGNLQPTRHHQLTTHHHGCDSTLNQPSTGHLQNTPRRCSLTSSFTIKLSQLRTHTMRMILLRSHGDGHLSMTTRPLSSLALTAQTPAPDTRQTLSMSARPE